VYGFVSTTFERESSHCSMALPFPCPGFPECGAEREVQHGCPGVAVAWEWLTRIATTAQTPAEKAECRYARMQERHVGRSELLATMPHEPAQSVGIHLLACKLSDHTGYEKGKCIEALKLWNDSD